MLVMKSHNKFYTASHTLHAETCCVNGTKSLCLTMHWVYLTILSTLILEYHFHSAVNAKPIQYCFKKDNLTITAFESDIPTISICSLDCVMNSKKMAFKVNNKMIDFDRIS